jgi:hypothetical protein
MSHLVWRDLQVLHQSINQSIVSDKAQPRSQSRSLFLQSTNIDSFLMISESPKFVTYDLIELSVEAAVVISALPLACHVSQICTATLLAMIAYNGYVGPTAAA